MILDIRDITDCRDVRLIRDISKRDIGDLNYESEAKYIRDVRECRDIKEVVLNFLFVYYYFHYYFLCCLSQSCPNLKLLVTVFILATTKDKVYF